MWTENLGFNSKIIIYMIVVLLGYMASGKSTIGKILANNLGYRFVDLDIYIEEKENNSIPELFEQKGEIYFRKKESIYLKELMNNEDKLVLSLGGGTPCYANNMDDILHTKNVISIYLKATIPTLVSRLQNEQNSRPLITRLDPQEDLTEFIGKHLFERSAFYSRAHLVISTDNKTQREILEELIGHLF